MIRRWLVGLALCLPLFVAPVTWAAGSDSSASESSATPTSDWEQAERLVEAGDYEEAIAVLFDIVRDDDQHADAYNLLGFTHRKTGKLDAALKYYRQALEIEPNHRGAHEYIGEAYLEMGDLASAKQHLAILDKACTFGCREYDMLNDAVRKYEARAN